MFKLSCVLHVLVGFIEFSDYRLIFITIESTDEAKNYYFYNDFEFFCRCGKTHRILSVY